MGVELHNGTPPSVGEITATALTAVREQQSKLADILETTRGAADALGIELRRAREDSNAVTAELTELEAELSQRRNSELAVQIIALRERQHALRQQEGRLGERLDGLAALGRRLQRTVQESEAIGVALADHGQQNDRSRLAGNIPWQVAQAQEDERERLAREIHDGPAQALANAIFELEFCERLMEKDPEKLRKEIVRLKDDLRQSLSDVRHFIFGLRPSILSELGLAAALRRFAEGFQSRCGIPVALDLDDPPRLTGTQETAIFRIIQEGLQNARKHSNACALKVTMRTFGDRLAIAIDDDGEGFDLATVAERGTGHYGLRGMRERARLLGASLEIDSKPGAGTRVTLNVPREARDAQANQ